jgi:hypothetical protein
VFYVECRTLLYSFLLSRIEVTEKLLELGPIGNIIQSSVMCVRLTPSHPASRIIAGLYILLATFLIGFFTAQAVSWLGDLTLPPGERVELDTVVEGPEQVNPCNNQDGISLLRWHDVPADPRVHPRRNCSPKAPLLTKEGWHAFFA